MASKEVHGTARLSGDTLFINGTPYKWLLLDTHMGVANPGIRLTKEDGTV